MSVFVVKCQSKRQQKVSKDLSNTINQYGSFRSTVDSAWLLSTDKSKGEVLKHVESHADASDLCYVVNVTEYAGCIPKDHWTWIKEHYDMP